MLHKDVSLLRLPIFAPTPNIVTTVNEIMAKHYQHFKTTQGYLSVWKKVVCLPRNGAISSEQLEIKNAKVMGNDGFGYTDRSLSNFVHSCSDVEIQKRYQHLTILLGI